MIIEDPLQCRIDNSKIIITIGFDALKLLAEESNNLIISDKNHLAKEVHRQFSDNTTMIQVLFENAINNMLDIGKVGVKFIKENKYE